MFINGEFFKKICNTNSAFLLWFIHNFAMIRLFPWTTATNKIHSLSGRILNITTDGKRPYVKAKVKNYGINFLYDTGASRTCMTMNTFQNAFPIGTPRKLKTNSISDELYDAGGKSLGCIGVYEMDCEVLGRKIKHPVRVSSTTCHRRHNRNRLHKCSLFVVRPRAQRSFLQQNQTNSNIIDDV